MLHVLLTLLKVNAKVYSTYIPPGCNLVGSTLGWILLLKLMCSTTTLKKMARNPCPILLNLRIFTVESHTLTFHETTASLG